MYGNEYLEDIANLIMDKKVNKKQYKKEKKKKITYIVNKRFTKDK